MPTRIILVVAEPQSQLADQLKQAFSSKSFRIVPASSGQEALQLTEQYHPFLSIISMTLADMDGIELIRRMQEQNMASQIHKIVLRDRPEEYVEVAAFQHGADDYVRSPIRLRAFIKRVEALIRREQSSLSSQPLKISPAFYIDGNQNLIHQHGVTFTLPKKEFKLLYLLASHPNRIFSRENLMTQIWEADVVVVPRTVDVHIRKIREKIGQSYIETVTGKGYRFIIPIQANKSVVHQ